MKCLSVRQPWADCIIPNQFLLDHWTESIPLPKCWENRVKWHYRYLGPILIHASKTYDPNGPKCDSQGHVYGAIIGRVTLTGIRRPEDSAAPPTWYQRGHFGLKLEKPIRFKEPVFGPGQLGLFEVPDSILPPEAFDAPEY